MRSATHALLVPASSHDGPSRLGRPFRALAAALVALLLAASAAFAQDAEDPAATNPSGAVAATAGTPTTPTVYELSQSQVPLGEAGVLLQRTPTGYVSTSYVVLDGLLDVANELVTRPDGTAVSYVLHGSSQGIEVNVAGAFDETGVTLIIEQADNRTEIEMNTDEPLYVLDNNFVDGFQILANVLLASGEDELDVPIVVPQVASIGRAVVRDTGESGSIVSDDERLEASKLAVTLTVLNQSVEIVLWVDRDGEIALLEQSIGAIRFERSRAATVAAASGGSPGEAHSGGPETASEVLARTAACVEVQKVEVESAGAVLQGLLSLPSNPTGAGEAPTLVLLPGSGPVDLRGNSLPLIANAGYEQLANALGCSGFGVLRVAKLGIAPSTGDPNAVTLDTYSFNAAEWFALLSETPGVDRNRLGVIGHSEGGLIALYAAASGIVDPKVIVLIGTAGRPLDVLLQEQLLASARRGGADAEALAQLSAQVDEVIAAVKSSTGSSLALDGELAGNPVAPLFAHAAGLLRSEMAHDPARLIAAVDAPIVILQGAKDMQVLPLDGQILADSAQRALLLELPDLTHNLVDVSGPAITGLVPAADAAISRTLVAALTSYLNGSLRLAR